MLLYFFFIFIIYYIFIAAILIGWNKIKLVNDFHELDPSTFISIVIAVRNEEENISRLIKCLDNQSFPKERFEVIFIDDNSQDNTPSIIQRSSKMRQSNIRLLKNDHLDNCLISPKKVALKKGIEHARGDIIIMTDGDCWFGNNWLKSMVSEFAQKQIMFASGPVTLIGDDTILSNIQIIEFSSLIGSGAATIGLNYPMMCNGANLAFRKEAFHQVQGYDGYANTISGDDVFLMQKIHHRYRKSINFAKNREAVVYSNTKKTIKEIINQRKRWASKWNKYPLVFSWFVPVFLFVHYASFVVGLSLLLMNPFLYWELFVLIILKFIFDLIVLKKVASFFKTDLNFLIFLLCELVYPVYALFVGIVVHLGTYEWKNRSYKI